MALTWLLAVLLLAPHVSGVDVLIGFHLSKDTNDVDNPNVYDGSLRTSPVQAEFSEKNCACTPRQCQQDTCAHCHLEGKGSEMRFYYVQNGGQKDVMMQKPTVTATPMCHTNPDHITLNTAATISQSDMVLGADAIGRIELEFSCMTLKADSAKTGLFDVEVSLPIKTAGDEDYDVLTWHFRKACVSQLALAEGLEVMFGGRKVVSGGEAKGVWHPFASSLFDVGYDPSDKDIVFSVTYRSADVDSGTITYDMAEPEFDETVIKSVRYRGKRFSRSAMNSMPSGSQDKMVARVTCQSHPRREANPGTVQIGMTNIRNAQGAMMQPVMFNFQVECPYHGHKITPLGVLFIVLGVFCTLGCIGGYVHNTHFSMRRGIDAVPLIDAVRSLLVRKAPSRGFPEVNGDDDVGLLEEEILPTVPINSAPAYGAI